MEKHINLFGSNLQGKALTSKISVCRKAVAESLRDYDKALEGAFSMVVKSNDRDARDCANAAKGRFKTAAAIVANCYPYITESGLLLRKIRKTDNEGNPIVDSEGKFCKIYAERALTAAAARGILKDSLSNFIKSVGEPTQVVAEIGQDC